MVKAANHLVGRHERGRGFWNLHTVKACLEAKFGLLTIQKQPEVVQGDSAYFGFGKP